MTKRYSTLLAVCFVLIASASTIFAQARASAKTQVISVDALGLFQGGGFISAQYEWRTAPTNSIHIRGIFSKYDAGANDTYSGFGVGGAYRFYIAESRALTGLSVAPVAHIFFFSSTFGRHTTALSIGGEVAYKWIFDQFSVEPGLGVQIGLALGENVGINFLTKTRPYAQVHLGYAW
jgi:hypothetical protein